MKHELKVTLLTLLLMTVSIVLPLWIGPDFGPDIHPFLGLLLEWMVGVVGIAFIMICLGIIGYVFSMFYELVEQFLSK